MTLEILPSPRHRATGCAGCNALLLVIVLAAVVVPGYLLTSMKSASARSLRSASTLPSSDFKAASMQPIEIVESAELADGVGETATVADCCEAAFLAAVEGAPTAPENDDEPVAARRPFDPPPGIEWMPLFNGKDLTGWTVTDFGGQGPIEVVDGELRLGFGQSMTGVTIDKEKEIPKINYEVQLAAQRVDGSDFFVGLTFPVNDDPCSLILGGWGGGVCGLSSLDYLDASENETTSYREFEKGRWYHIRLRVQELRIDAWLDNQKIVDQRIVGRKIGIRPEVHRSVPFGLATYETTGAIKNLRIRPLADEEVEKE